MRTVIKFGAPWCQPCKQLAPLLARKAEQNPDTVYMDVDIEEDRSVLDDWLVIGVPTVVVLDAEGVEVERATGPQAARLL